MPTVIHAQALRLPGAREAGEVHGGRQVRHLPPHRIQPLPARSYQTQAHKTTQIFPCESGVVLYLGFNMLGRCGTVPWQR